MKKSTLSIAAFTLFLAGFYPAYVLLLGQLLFVEEPIEKIQIEESATSQSQTQSQTKSPALQNWIR